MAMIYGRHRSVLLLPAVTCHVLVNCGDVKENTDLFWSVPSIQSTRGARKIEELIHMVQTEYALVSKHWPQK